MKLQFIVSDQTNPYWNIAVENYLLSLPESEVITLYLWRNRRTVVIGQNQNPFTECNVDALEADGGYLMRRRTGGGAVYHDDGNINFSFVVPKALYDQTRQFRVLQRAVAAFGLQAEVSGRNDVLVDGRKFSGNAFSKGRYQDLHHGTILIKGNMEDLQRYLKPKPAKLRKHGVSSVQSRVVNLSELNPAITSESIVPALRVAFESEYSGNSEYSDFSEIIKRPEVRTLYEEFASDEWRFGRWRTFTAQRSAQFDWGGVELQLTVDQEHSLITDVQIASDALDLAALDEVRSLLTGAGTATPPPHEPNPIVDDILSLVYN
ncbi:MAG: lipoate--protein ligase [Bacteroidales bacterium]|nr:lipoate--protein ligase [Bacteroidales bacterium]